MNIFEKDIQLKKCDEARGCTTCKKVYNYKPKYLKDDKFIIASLYELKVGNTVLALCSGCLIKLYNEISESMEELMDDKLNVINPEKEK